MLDYDDARAFYVGVLGWDLLEDTDLGGGKRWLRVRPPGSDCGILLARAVTERQVATVGAQTGGRVFIFLETTEFDSEYERLRAAGVRFARERTEESWGTVAVFADLYGNLYDLIQRR